MGQRPETGECGESDVRRFVERFALALHDAGIPRMPARVFALLISTNAGRMTASELASGLGVSAAAISGAVRYLVQAGMVIRDRDPGARTDHYRLPGDLWYEVYFQRTPLIEQWEHAAAEGVDILGPDTPAGQRMQETRAFFAFFRDEMSRVVERWRDHREHLRQAGELPG